MLPRRPEDWPALFSRAIGDGDLDAAAFLYEPGAAFIRPDAGETLAGREAIRAVLAGLIGKKTRLHGNVVKSVTVGDVAVLDTDWSEGKAVEVLRRQPDGSWLLVFGDPNGRA